MDYKQELEKRISADYKRRVKQWMASDPAQLIDMAEEIIATRLIHDNLLDAIHDGDATFLLQLDDPLDRMSNRWISENGLDTVHKDELLHCVESLRAEQALGRPMSEVFQQRIKENYDQFLKDWEQLDVQTCPQKSRRHANVSMGFAAWASQTVNCSTFYSFKILWKWFGISIWIGLNRRFSSPLKWMTWKYSWSICSTPEIWMGTTHW